MCADVQAVIFIHVQILRHADNEDTDDHEIHIITGVISKECDHELLISNEGI